MNWLKWWHKLPRSHGSIQFTLSHPYSRHKASRVFLGGFIMSVIFLRETFIFRRSQLSDYCTIVIILVSKFWITAFKLFTKLWFSQKKMGQLQTKMNQALFHWAWDLLHGDWHQSHLPWVQVRQCFRASDWLKFVNPPQIYVFLLFIQTISQHIYVTFQIFSQHKMYVHASKSFNHD